MRCAIPLVDAPEHLAGGHAARDHVDDVGVAHMAQMELQDSARGAFSDSDSLSPAARPGSGGGAPDDRPVPLAHWPVTRWRSTRLRSSMAKTRV